MNEMKEMIKTLEENSVFVRTLESSEIPYHSQYMAPAAKKATEVLKQKIINPKLRSKKWLSTALLSEPTEEALKYASAEYFVYNLMNPVCFYERLQQLPSNAIVLELSPHPIFVRSVTETLENSTFISLLKKDSNHTNLDLFLSGLAKLYELGINLSIDKLYPRVEWPVARNTQSIGSLIKWDHSFKYSHKLYPENYNRFNASDMNIYVDSIAKEDVFYLDHSLNGRAIFPAAGYLMLAWRLLAAGFGRIWYQLPVIFENIHFKTFILLSQTSVTHIKVKLFPTTGIPKGFQYKKVYNFNIILSIQMSL